MNEWHACQDGDMYYIQSDPEDEHYVASFENESDADDYCEYLKSKEVNKCEEYISKCSFCKTPLTDKELKYGKTLLFSLMCDKCYKEYQKESYND